MCIKISNVVACIWVLGCAEIDFLTFIQTLVDLVEVACKEDGGSGEEINALQSLMNCTPKLFPTVHDKEMPCNAMIGAV